jgi:archaellum component FlaG (FlaF/FlaG flagellin family)
MSRYCIFIISIIISFLAASAAPDWHDDIVSTMNTADEIDRNIVVNRHPNSRRITNASYRYTFKSKAVYNSIREKLLSRESDAATVIIKPGKNGEIIMRFRRPQETRNYRLSTIKKGKYQLVISVNDDPDVIYRGTTTSQLNDKQVQIMIQNAAKAKENAAKARRNANKTSMTASTNRSRSSKIVTVGNSNSAEAKAVSAELKAAEQERKRLLNK